MPEKKPLEERLGKEKASEETDIVAIFRDLAHPKDATLHYHLGIVYNRKKEYDKAIECFEKAIEVDPNHTQAHIGLSVVYWKKGDEKQAKKYLQKADELLKKYNEKQKKHEDFKNRYVDKAIKDLEETTELNPKNAEAYSILGFAYMVKKEYDKAIKHLEKAIELNPKDARAYTHLGIAYHDKGEPEKAEEYLQKAEELENAKKKTT